MSQVSFCVLLRSSVDDSRCERREYLLHAKREQNTVTTDFTDRTDDLRSLIPPSVQSVSSVVQFGRSLPLGGPDPVGVPQAQEASLESKSL